MAKTYKITMWNPATQTTTDSPIWRHMTLANAYGELVRVRANNTADVDYSMVEESPVEIPVKKDSKSPKQLVALIVRATVQSNKDCEVTDIWGNRPVEIEERMYDNDRKVEDYLSRLFKQLGFQDSYAGFPVSYEFNNDLFALAVKRDVCWVFGDGEWC